RLTIEVFLSYTSTSFHEPFISPVASLLFVHAERMEKEIKAIKRNFLITAQNYSIVPDNEKVKIKDALWLMGRFQEELEKNDGHPSHDRNIRHIKNAGLKNYKL